MDLLFGDLAFLYFIDYSKYSIAVLYISHFK